MKIERSKEWWMARARREGDAAVGAGLLAFDPVPDELICLGLLLAYAFYATEHGQ